MINSVCRMPEWKGNLRLPDLTASPALRRSNLPATGGVMQGWWEEPREERCWSQQPLWEDGDHTGSEEASLWAVLRHQPTTVPQDADRCSRQGGEEGG